MIGSVLPVDAAAARASLARVVGIDEQHGHPGALGLVGHESPELTECPRVQTRPLTATGRYPFVDMGQFLQPNAASGALRILNDRLRNHVVGVCAKSPFAARQLPQSPLGGLGTATLQTALAARHPTPDFLDRATAVERAVTVSGEIDDSEIDAEPVLGFELLSLRHVAGSGEIPLTADKAEIDLALAIGQKPALMLAYGYGDHQPPLDGPQVDGVSALDEADNPIVIGLRRIGPEDRRNLAVDFEGVGDFSDGPHCCLCRQFEALPQIGISKMVKVKLAERAVLKPHPRQPRRRIIAALQCHPESRSILGGRQKLDGGDQLHLSNIEERTANYKRFWRRSRAVAFPLPVKAGSLHARIE